MRTFRPFVGRALFFSAVCFVGTHVQSQTTEASSVSHDEVTIEFSAPRSVGKFIDGYPYVVGRTEIIGYTPACKTLEDGRIINGAMINPDCGLASGFDSGGMKSGDRQAKWVPELNVGAGISKQKTLVLEPGQSLLIATSNLGVIDRNNPLLKRVVLLTCLAEAPPADAFRPAFANADKTIHTWSQVKTDRLKNLEVVGTAPTWDSINERFTRFLMDMVPNWDRGHLSPGDHAPLYGRDLSRNAGAAYLMVNSNFPLEEKKPALIGLIQRGIDHYGMFQNTKRKGIQPWAADGGHHGGRKFSIMFAGAMLGDEAMENVVLQTEHDNLASSKRFQEDIMSFYVDENLIKISNSPEWKPAYQDAREQQPYSPSMLGMPDWRGNVQVPACSASWTGHPYRISANTASQHGQALAALVMGLRPAWRNEAYFDYHARFLEIMAGRPDPWGTMRGEALSYPPVIGSTPEEGWADWMQHWKDAWSWDMIQHHWKNHYRYPWQS